MVRGPSHKTVLQSLLIFGFALRTFGSAASPFPQEEKFAEMSLTELLHVKVVSASNTA